jgi:hypothetical protein
MASGVKPLSESSALGLEAVRARRVAIAVREDRDNPAIDLALVLAVDVSGSVSTERLTLQFQGYSEAFTHPDLVLAVKHGRHGRIATTFVEWSDSGRQYQAVDWTLIDSEEAARAFGKAIAEATRQNPGWTSISGAIDFSVRLLTSVGYRATKRVIDISGDGANNDGRPADQARDAAVAAGITINGLPLIEVEPDLADYYRGNVIGGPNAFVVVARQLSNFSEAVLKKLLVEIAGSEGMQKRSERPPADIYLARFV